jgi:excinuclease ABC subunit A
VKCADWILDLGPEGGDAGGRIVAEGPPEKIATTAASYTGQFLSRVLQSVR